MLHGPRALLILGSVVIGGGIVMALVHSASAKGAEDHAQSFDQFTPDPHTVEPFVTALEWGAFL